MADDSLTTDLVFGLPFFRRHSDLQLFKRLGFTAVIAVGPESGRPLKIGWSSNPRTRIAQIQTDNWKTMKLHDIVWTPGPPTAMRLEEEVKRLLKKAGRHLRGDWYDVPVEMIVPTIQVAIDNTKVPTFTHDTMLQHFAEAKGIRADLLLSGLGETIRAA